MKTFEAGISNPQNTNEIHWTGETVIASSQREAEEAFSSLGFYRNLVVREDNPCDDPVHCHNGVCRMTASCVRQGRLS